MDKNIVIKGAKEHNLKNINLVIPKNKLVVITGVSGSGKSSLAFDTIYAEGQRRYVESLSSYARQFLGIMNKPDVQSIDGLSPAISIDQKTTSNNPRSTVGTVTEIYDYLRLLYARVGIPHCPVCGRKIQKQSSEQIVDSVLKLKENTKIQVLAPVVRGKKGEHRNVIEDMQKQGFVRAKIDNKLYDLSFDNIELSKTKKHNIDIIVDRLIIKDGIRQRLAESIETAMKFANNLVTVEVIGGKSTTYSGNYSCPEHDIGFEELSPRLFSFNNPYGACDECSGIGYLLRISEDLVIPDKNKTLYDGIKAFGSSELKRGDTMAKMYFESIGNHFNVKIEDVKIKDLPREFMEKILYGTGSEIISFTYASETGVREFDRPFEGVLPTLERRHKETKSEGMRRFYELYMHEMPCRKCNGTRLKEEVLYVLVGNLNIHELTSLSIDKIRKYLDELDFDETEMMIAESILKETSKRLQFLENVGLSYLTLSRAAGSLSGGEAQRIRLATQIGSGLTGVLYILDEPSIGLHQRDNDKLLGTLKNLRDLGNTVIVVEHDEDTMRAADHIIDIGPEAGVNGGKLVAQGTVEDIVKVKNSLTGKYLSGEYYIPTPKKRRRGSGKSIEIIGAKENNLKDISVKIPLGKLIVVTGVSGSGKSTLIYNTLYINIKNELNRTVERAGEVEEIKGIGNIDKIISIDQSPIGRTPRSNPATYTGVMDDIRDVFAGTNEAKMRGYQKGRFSFNVKGGRCEVCEGDGLIKIEMHFLPDVYVPCEVCNGSRYNRETLEVRFKGKNISEVLEMNAFEAIEVFSNLPKIRNRLQLLIDVGLGYIKLGQNSTTLSGGEAQRIKIAKELSKKSTGKTLYILDEPTTGLHTHDIAKLIEILNRLVDSGNTIIVIEHNLDLIKTADHIIDLGPEGGDSGGMIIAEGSPEEITKVKESYTGKYLKKSKNMV